MARISIYTLSLVLFFGLGCDQSVSNALPVDGQLEESDTAAELSDEPSEYRADFGDAKCLWAVLTFSTQEEFENDSLVIIGGPPLYGEAVLYVNGSPIFYNDRGTNIRIQEFLIPGKNTIELRGDHRRLLSVKVYESNECHQPDPSTFGQPRVKLFKEPEEESKKVVFHVEDVPPIKIPELPQEGPQREKLEQLLRDKINRIASAIENHDGEKYVKEMYAGRYRAAKAVNTDLDDRGFHESNIETVNDPETDVYTDLTKSEILWGERTVFVYSRSREDDIFSKSKQPCFFEAMAAGPSGNSYAMIPPQRFMYIFDTWIRL